MFQAHALADIVKATAIRIAGNGQRCRGEHGSFKVFKERLLQDLRHVNRCCLQHNVRLPAARATPFAAIFNPEDRVLVC